MGKHPLPVMGLETPQEGRTHLHCLLLFPGMKSRSANSHLVPRAQSHHPLTSSRLYCPTHDTQRRPTPFPALSDR
ncbi:hypothetical protein TIFTF001_018197 [Ficus carica]|uniref:Uncharacterized protein n=1 Tax=Ficus carica TaxID=3494 RepID=A0AA88DJ63_FICCA|nr:hypothetical protein TIFTF001_018197 [Ficus carica]